MQNSSISIKVFSRAFRVALKALETFPTSCENFMAILGSSFIGILCLMVVLSLILRAVLMPLMFVGEMAGYLMVAIVFLIASQAVRKGEFVRVTFLLDHLSPNTSNRLLVISNIVSSLFILVVCFYSWLMLIASYKDGICSNSMYRVPIYLTQISVVIGFTLITIRLILQTYESALGLLRKQ